MCVYERDRRSNGIIINNHTPEGTKDQFLVDVFEGLPLPITEEEDSPKLCKQLHPSLGGLWMYNRQFFERT